MDTKICEEFTKLQLEPAIIITWLQNNFDNDDHLISALKFHQLTSKSYLIKELNATLYFTFDGIPPISLIVPLKLCPIIRPKRTGFHWHTPMPSCEFSKRFHALPTNRTDLLTWLNCYFAKTAVTHDITLLHKTCYLDDGFIVFKLIFRHRGLSTTKRFGVPSSLVD